MELGLQFWGSNNIIFSINIFTWLRAVHCGGWQAILVKNRTGLDNTGVEVSSLQHMTVLEKWGECNKQGGRRHSLDGCENL